MFNRIVVQEALKMTGLPENNPGVKTKKPLKVQDSEISLLIHDVFGGEILKTHKKKGWHFYNRVNGERIDFTGSNGNGTFDDIPSTPDETYSYLSKEDYSSFFMRFVRAFEEAVGLERPQTGYSA